MSGKDPVKLDDEQLAELREIFRVWGLVEPDLIQAKCPYTEDQLKKISCMFDRDGNGYITPAELAHSMAKLGHALTADELTGMIKEADTDGDGCINFQEFAQAITSATLDNSWC
ncbi:hypothetical protein GH714_027844 [Hevea brasiliensis]|uniref:EF-hand domain-containing protein n=1 Tax=Hevea brasiliensis TaxID=3981 RepID=A0A6A6KL94_HEVBR|nr:hypothetical protein GH714_027844 [Hevea brasiliensis]